MEVSIGLYSASRNLTESRRGVFSQSRAIGQGPEGEEGQEFKGFAGRPETLWAGANAPAWHHLYLLLS